ncbi:hypothetical protein Tco_0636172 [Tanacetum coccineum]
MAAQNQVPRKENKKADALSKMASTSFAHLSKQVLVEELKEKSVNEIEVLAIVEEEGDSWMTPIHEYLNSEILLAEWNKARSIKQKSQRFIIINGTLYKKSFLGPWLSCVGPSQANYDWLLLADNAQGRKGAYKSMSGMPSAQTRPKKSIGKIEPNHISVAILQMGYRHSWTFPGRTRQSQIPNSGHGLLYQVDRSKTSSNYHRKPSKKLRMGKHTFCFRKTSLDERTGRKSKQKFGGRNKSKTGQRQQELVGIAVIPTEIGMTTFRTTEVDVAENNEALEINLELLEEKREQAAIREAKSKRQMEKYYNTKVRNASFKPGELVYQSNEASRVEDTEKLGPKWEGPYEVTEALGKGSYKLKDRNGRELSRTWNICNLKKCYINKV